MSFWGLRPQGVALDPLGALRRPRPPAYFGMSLCVHIISILAMSLLRAFEKGGIFIVPHLL
jgi:hypothetical protein